METNNLLTTAVNQLQKSGWFCGDTIFQKVWWEYKSANCTTSNRSSREINLKFFTRFVASSVPPAFRKLNNLIHYRPIGDFLKETLSCKTFLNWPGTTSTPRALIQWKMPKGKKLRENFAENKLIRLQTKLSTSINHNSNLRCGVCPVASVTSPAHPKT